MAGNSLSPEQYAEMAGKIGNHTQVAKLLGIQRETMSRRCNGHITPITRESVLALRFISNGDKPRKPKQGKNKKPEGPPRCIFL